MTDTKKPNKEAVKKYLDERHKDKLPPPTPEEIRRILGWDLIDHKDDMSEGTGRA